ncbi:MAG: hypothetical protein QGG09_13350 [Pirellulaceae bacterium]|nr:hypothetical protein [Pirellulaceae bacterium]HJN11369.1 hypothetical protein [Pirellulaceae bacterium]
MLAHMNDELNRLIQQHRGGPCRLALDTPVGELTAQLEMIDQLACTFSLLRLQADKLAAATIDELAVVAAGLSSQLSYLLESISPVEIDRDMCVVQMRSNPPEQGDQGTFYYELVVRLGAIDLCRYQKSPSNVRQTVPATVTREVLGRLAEDFVAAVAK